MIQTWIQSMCHVIVFLLVTLVWVRYLCSHFSMEALSNDKTGIYCKGMNCFGSQATFSWRGSV